MSQRIRWGILGTGRVAAEFAASLLSLEDAELVAVGSRREDTAKLFAARFNISRTYGSYEALVADPQIDVVYIATPPAMHAANCLLSIEAGKPVLCEKPFTLNAREADAVIAAARQRGVFLMEAMWTRFVPAIVKLRDLLDQAVIGEPQIMIAGGAFIPDFDPEFYLFNRELGGGVLLDAGVYLISLASMVFGAPSTVLGVGVLGDSGVDEHDSIILGHASGTIANLYVSLRARRAPDALLLGSNGKIYLHPPIFCPGALTISIADSADETLSLASQGSGYQYQAAEVMRCLRAGKLDSDIMPLAETRQIMQTMDSVRAQIGLSYPDEN